MIITRSQTKMLQLTNGQPEPFPIMEWVTAVLSVLLDAVVLSAMGMGIFYLFVCHCDIVATQTQKAENCIVQLALVETALARTQEEVVSCKGDYNSLNEMYIRQARFLQLVHNGLAGSVCLNIILAILCYIFFQSNVKETKRAILWVVLGLSFLTIAFCVVQ